MSCKQPAHSQSALQKNCRFEVFLNLSGDKKDKRFAEKRFSAPRSYVSIPRKALWGCDHHNKPRKARCLKQPEGYA